MHHDVSGESIATNRVRIGDVDGLQRYLRFPYPVRHLRSPDPAGYIPTRSGK
jgi:hypothetical protein